MPDSYSPVTVSQLQRMGAAPEFQRARSVDQRAIIRKIAALYAMGEIECAILMQADPDCYDRYGRPRS